MSNLVEHARRELEALGVEENEILNTLPVIQAFANARDSGSSAAWRIAVIHDLLQFKPLSALTDNPSEWNLIAQRDLFDNLEVDVWQSRRNSEAFSNDGGKTYYLVTEMKNGYKKTYYTEAKNGNSRRDDSQDGVGTN